MVSENWASRESDADAGANAGSPDRLHIHLSTFIASEDAAPLPIVIDDISSGGFSGECAFVRIGSRIRVQLPRIGDVDATIIWASKGRVGAKFIQPVASIFLLENFAA